MIFKQYFLRLGGRMTSGPVDERTLRKLAATGRLTENVGIALSPDGPWHTLSLMRCGVVISVHRIGDAESAIIDQRRAFALATIESTAQATVSPTSTQRHRP